MVRSLRVGALINPIFAHSSELVFTPLPDHTKVATAIRSDEQFGKGIAYPPIVRDTSISEPGRKSGVMIQQPWFSYAPTHQLTWRRPISGEHAAFTTLALGFLLGVRLLPEGSGYLGRAAVAEGKWYDFLAYWQKDGPVLLSAIENSGEVAKLIKAFELCSQQLMLIRRASFIATILNGRYF